MRNVLIAVIAALTLAGTAQAASTAPYQLDSKGKCHASNGQFAKQSLCGAPTYKLDAKGKCHGPNGGFVTASMCKPIRPA